MFKKNLQNTDTGTKVYVAGPMSGMEEFNYPAFYSSRTKLGNMGFIPVLPIDDDDLDDEGNQTKSQEEYYRKDIKKMLDCDSVFALVGWEKSKGATLELLIASLTGIPAYKENGYGLIERPVIFKAFFERWVVAGDDDETEIEEVEVTPSKTDTKGVEDIPETPEPEDDTTDEEEFDSILEEAEYVVTGDRERDYGSPLVNHSRTASLWSIYLGKKIAPQQVCIMNILQKVSRSMNKLTRDTLVDIAGYARNIELIEEDRILIENIFGRPTNDKE